ncbi:hypothetical protein FE257_000405 [Aspergillus nanangensis]|uniref:Uncharacterized protein n=1 Tax=Aspergillus nanangensis TaxID=2582783 RepID=A0AAD4CU83_ASPNN|nr:hypothetical protein FE257_000405 [Aspergillus nanangensis]
MSSQSINKTISSLCDDFSTGRPLANILSNFTISPPPIALEHGLPQLAPFLGREFTGLDGLQEYFTLIGDLLTIKSMRFDAQDQWVVDIAKGVVCLRGYARFSAKETDQSWDEVFIYRIEGVGNECGEWKVRRYEVWADSGAAYLALKGLLEKDANG